MMTLHGEDTSKPFKHSLPLDFWAQICFLLGVQRGCEIEGRAKRVRCRVARNGGAGLPGAQRERGFSGCATKARVWGAPSAHNYMRRWTLRPIGARTVLKHCWRNKKQNQNTSHQEAYEGGSAGVGAGLGGGCGAR